jgi:hypothetical protein
MSRKVILKSIKKGSIGAEIGVWSGEFSVDLLTTNPNKLYLVDPWEYITSDIEIMNKRRYTGGRAKNQNDMDEVYNDVVKKFNHLENIEISRNYSNDWFDTIDDNSLDFTYIDGNHSERYVYSDLCNSYKKVKKGGLICGDDYDWFEDDKYDVKIAVEKFLEQHKDVTFTYKGKTQFILTK